MKIHEILKKPINEMSSGATGSGAIAATPGVGGAMIKRSQVGSLFGGTYQQPKKRKAKKK